MLDLRDAAAAERIGVAVLGVAQRIPEAERRLHAELGLEGPQRGVGVETPVPPGGAGEPVLEEHANDGHHGKTAICEFGVELSLAELGIEDGAAGIGRAQDAAILEVARAPRGVPFEKTEFQDACEEEYLQPTNRG